MQAGVAKSLDVPQSNVLVGAYVKGGDTRRLGPKDRAVLMEVADLNGHGSSANAMRSFLRTRYLADRHTVSAGSLGGGAACATLKRVVAQCIWADRATYASFFGWNMSTATLHQLMLAARPRSELARR